MEDHNQLVKSCLIPNSIKNNLIDLSAYRRLTIRYPWLRPVVKVSLEKLSLTDKERVAKIQKSKSYNPKDSSW